MGQHFIVWVVRPIIGVFIGQVFLQTLHLCSLYPDRYVAERAAAVIQKPPADLIFWSQAFLTVFFGIVLLVVYELIMRRFRPVMVAAAVAADQTSTVQASSLRLSTNQKKIIADSAIAPPGGPHVVVMTALGGCLESQIFSETLRDLLNGLPGWEAHTGIAFGPSRTMRGIKFYLENKSNVPASLDVLARALQKAQVSFSIEEDRNLFKPDPRIEFAVEIGPITD